MILLLFSEIAQKVGTGGEEWKHKEKSKDFILVKLCHFFNEIYVLKAIDIAIFGHF